MEETVGMLVVFGSTSFVLYAWLSSRHKEKMAMIEKGVSPSDFKSGSIREFFRTNPLSSLKWGLLALFVGLGLFGANILDRLWYFDDSVYPASMLSFGGLALILFYWIASNKLKSEE